MASIAFPQSSKFHKLSTGHTYNYVSIPASGSSPTILFLHGFPSTSHDWRHQISHFSSKGYGILAPDLLGYGGTSKPTISSISAYKGRRMASELVEILDHEKITSVHGVGHDWGVTLLSRFANYFPSRLISCSFLSIPYLKPGDHFDLDVVNAMTKKYTGAEKFGYMGFFSELHSGNVVDAHAESFFNLFYPADPKLWIEHMGPTGAMEAFISKDTQAPLAAYVTEEEKKRHLEIFNGQWQAPMNWYRAGLVWNLWEDEEKEAIANGLDVKLNMPVLVVLEPAEMAFLQEKNQRELCTDWRVRGTDGGGHWVQLEKKDQVNGWLEEFFQGDMK